MNARGHRGVGKSDPLDAQRIAAAVLPLDVTELRHPRRDEGARAALRVLVAARDHMTGERTGTVNALTGLVRSTDLGLDARRPLNTKQIDEISKWRTRSEDLGSATARAEAVRLAKRVIALDEELTANHAQMSQLIGQSPAAGLLDKTGIGAVTAAVVLTAWSHPGRVRSEASFACLAGVNPIPASSGNTVRYRLNRGGDRRLNQALHMAVVTRMRMDPGTRAYVERRTAEGRTSKEIRRCLKRYLGPPDLPPPRQHLHRCTADLTDIGESHAPNRRRTTPTASMKSRQTRLRLRAASQKRSPSLKASATGPP